MKKQINPAVAGRKLRLNKRTISNLAASEMNMNNIEAAGPTKKGIGCFTHRCNPSW